MFGLKPLLGLEPMAPIRPQLLVSHANHSATEKSICMYVCMCMYMCVCMYVVSVHVCVVECGCRDSNGNLYNVCQRGGGGGRYLKLLTVATSVLVIIYLFLSRESVINHSVI